MALQPRVVDACHLRVALQIFGKDLCVGAVPGHAQWKCFEILDRQPRVEGLHRTADKFGRVPADVFGQRFGSYDGAAENGCIAREELGDRQEDDVRAERQRLLQRSCRRGVVYQERNTPAVCHIRHCADIGHKERRVARCLDPHQFGPVVDSRIPCPRVLRILNKVELDAAALGKDCGRLLVPLTKSHQGGDDIVAGSRDSEDQAEQGLRAGASCHTGPATFEHCKPFLQH